MTMTPDERAVYEEQDYKWKVQPSLIACSTISGSFMATVQSLRRNYKAFRRKTLPGHMADGLLTETC